MMTAIPQDNETDVPTTTTSTAALDTQNGHRKGHR